MVTIMVAQHHTHRGNPTAVERLDGHARWVFPAAFVVALLALWVVYH